MMEPSNDEEGNEHGSMMKYRIGDIQKLFGIPNVTTRFFEEKGIISAQRGKDNNYRWYQATDLNKLFIYKVYRSLKFDTKKATNMVSGHSLEQFAACVAEQQSVLEEQRKELERAEKRLHYLQKLLDNYGLYENKLTKTTIPDMVFVLNQIRDEFLFHEKILENNRFCFHVIQACMPVLKLEYGREDITYGYGILTDIDATDVLLERGENLEGRSCLYGTMCLEKSKSQMAAIRNLLEPYLETHRHVAITGEIYSHMFHEEKRGENVFRYYEIWLLTT